MRSVRFVRAIQLDESGALSGNGSSDKHRVGNEEILPFKLLLNRGGFLPKTQKVYISFVVIAPALGCLNAAPLPQTARSGP